MDKNTMASQDRQNATYEVRDAHFRGLLFTGIGLLVLMALNMVISWGAYSLFREDSARPGEMPLTFTAPEGSLPQPALQSNPREDLLRLRAREDSLLSGYGWVNREAGLARIPIDSAMRRLLHRGLPTRSNIQP